MPVAEATSRALVKRCFPVLAQLRPHLTEASFLSRFEVQAREGYRLAFLEEGGRVRAVAGYRVQHMLYQQETGRMVYVDDLVTDRAVRSAGHGRRLLAWIVERARGLGCDAVELDSGVQRVAAHRFYLGQGMHIAAYHFRKPLRSDPPETLSFAAGPARMPERPARRPRRERQ